MPKNLKGGNKAKKGRTFGPSTFRPAKEEGEVYAKVIKNMGNGILEVHCIDDEKRQCIVRKKFVGRQRDALIVGSWILVGLREWETKSNKCDLLEIYTPTDVDRLLTTSGNWSVLLGEKDDIDFIEDVEVAPQEVAEINMEVDFDDI